VASLIAGRTVGVAKNATIYSVRVLDGNNFGTFSNFIAGVDYVFRQAIKPAIANMSFGQLAGEDMKLARALETSVSSLIASGITCVAAAPNLKIDAAQESPGRLADCLTVGVSNSTTDERGGGFGAGIDVFAPGEGLVCVAVTADDLPPNPSMLTTITGGTSTAAALVTGVAAMFLEKNPSATPAQVMEAIKTNATKDVLKNIPAGTKNRLLYSSFI
jgi:subtilisin family serine protease